MSKPREFWILKAHNCVVLEEEPRVQVKDFVHVIEKSAAEKLTEALEAILLAVRNEYEDYYRWIDKHGIPVTKEYTECIAELAKELVPAQDALKEYRGEE
jgi:hypothetical protein